MTPARRMQEIERFVERAMSRPFAPELRIAHDFKHVDRVRRWALRIAEGEGFGDLALVEAAALLHDVGLAHVERRSEHAEAGARVAARFLRERGLFNEPGIDAIGAAIRCHSSPDGGGRLGEILRDADKLDALGAVGLMRAFTSKHALPEYAPDDVKGETWGMTMEAFEERFALGQGIGDYILDQVNFQISFYGDLRTETARRLGEPLTAFMRTFLCQLEAEIVAQQQNR